MHALFRSLAFALAIVLTGCIHATMSMLPADAASVNFSSAEGKTGWSKYEHVTQFPGYSHSQLYEAAKVGLGDAAFSLRTADLSKGVVIGEHGMTAHDWNVMAGVYIKDVAGVPTVKVIAHGSKDTGFSGDVTSEGWTGKILKGMRQHLNATYHHR